MTRDVWRHRATTRPVGIVLGVNEIASAVGVALHRRGHITVLSHDPVIPVIRRGMAFRDALYGETAVVAGVRSNELKAPFELALSLAAYDHVMVTRLERRICW